MKEILRVDKYLADMGLGTRSEVKNYIKAGRIRKNDVPVKKPEEKVKIQLDQITFDGQNVTYTQYEYYMLHKPAGYVSATEDGRYPTVLDLIPQKNRKDLFPVGRLDLDTEGLLLITNDGMLAHQLLSPKKHVPKVYYARVSGEVTSKEAEQLLEGVDIGEGIITSPAKLRILEAGEISSIELTIYEGKFHQVKRMFLAVGKKVLYLKRLSMGPLTLDENLECGACRQLTKEELEALKRT